MATAPINEQQGDELTSQSRETLFDDALPRIYGYILVRVGGDHAIAEDLTQETMLALARALLNSHPRIVDPIAWLFGTARFKVIDHYRRSERTDRTDTGWSGAINDVAAEIDDFDRIAERDELMTALKTLPPGQQIALVLHYADGLSIDEIATGLGKSQSAVESLLARGRRTLRTRLTDQESNR